MDLAPFPSILAKMAVLSNDTCNPQLSKQSSIHPICCKASAKCCLSVIRHLNGKSSAYVIRVFSNAGEGLFMATICDACTDALTSINEESRPLYRRGLASLTDPTLRSQTAFKSTMSDMVLRLMKPMQQNCGEFQWTATHVKTFCQIFTR